MEKFKDFDKCFGKILGDFGKLQTLGNFKHFIIVLNFFVRALKKFENLNKMRETIQTSLEKFRDSSNGFGKF